MKRIITAAALAAALLAGAPRAAAVCPYTVGPLGRYIAPAIVQGMTATDDGNAVEVWCTDALDGDDWFFTVDNETELKIYSRVNLVIDANGTPDDFTDDRVIDALFCQRLHRRLKGAHNMKSLEEIRIECRNENHAARRLLSAGFRLEGWDMNTGRRIVARITNENTNDEQRTFYEFPNYQTAAAELLA